MSDKKRLSVVMIAKNSADLIADCLTSVHWADEIIVLDSGSSDNTCQIAQAMGAKVFSNTEWTGFGRQRQLAQQYASGDYIFMIDTDERVTPELRASIEQVLAHADNSKVYSCARRNLFLGRFMNTVAGTQTASSASMPATVINTITIRFMNPLKPMARQLLFCKGIYFILLAVI